MEFVTMTQPITRTDHEIIRKVLAGHSGPAIAIALDLSETQVEERLRLVLEYVALQKHVGNREEVPR